MLWIGRVGVFLPLLVIVRCHLGDYAVGKLKSLHHTLKICFL